MSVVQSCNMGGCNPIKSLRNPMHQWGFNLRFVLKLRHIKPTLEWKLSCSAWQSKIKVKLEIQPLDSISDQKAPSIGEAGGKRFKVHDTQGETSDMSLKKVGINFWTHNICILYIKANMVFVCLSVWTKIGQCLEDSSGHCPFPVELVYSRWQNRIGEVITWARQGRVARAAAAGGRARCHFY